MRNCIAQRRHRVARADKWSESMAVLGDLYRHLKDAKVRVNESMRWDLTNFVFFAFSEKKGEKKELQFRKIIKIPQT